MYFSTSHMYVGCTLVLFGILSSALNSFPSLACLGHLRLSFGLTPRKSHIFIWSSANLSPLFLMVPPLQLPQVLIKPRKMHSSSSAVHWRRPAELGYQIYPPSSPIIWYSSNWNGLGVAWIHRVHSSRLTGSQGTPLNTKWRSATSPNFLFFTFTQMSTPLIWFRSNLLSSIPLFKTDWKFVKQLSWKEH